MRELAWEELRPWAEACPANDNYNPTGTATASSAPRRGTRSVEMPLAAELIETGLEVLLNTNIAALRIASSPSANEADAQGLAREVVVLSPQTQLRDALRVLAANRILSAPVLSSLAGEDATVEQQFEGFCDVASILKYLLGQLPPELLEDIPDASADAVVRTMDALSCLTYDILAAPVSVLPRRDGDLVSRNFASSSLLDVVQAAFIHPVHLRDVAICHRVAAADVRPELDARASLCSVSPQSMSVVTHMDIIRLLYARVEELGPLADASVETLSLAGPDLFVFFVSSQLSALRTLVELDEHNLSAAGVVNDAGELVANVSVSDLRDVQVDKAGILALPVLEFLAVQAGFRRPRTPVTVLPSDSLRSVLERMVVDAVHHVYVVTAEAVRRPTAIITPSDILYLFDTRPTKSASGSKETGHSRYVKDA